MDFADRAAAGVRLAPEVLQVVKASLVEIGADLSEWSIMIVVIAPGGVSVATPVIEALAEHGVRVSQAQVRFVHDEVVGATSGDPVVGARLDLSQALPMPKQGASGQVAPESAASTLSPPVQVALVVADGVETGRAAAAVASTLAQAGWHRRWLAVPVCPRQSRPALEQRYEKIIALVTPLARRSLRWHYGG